MAEVQQVPGGQPGALDLVDPGGEGQGRQVALDDHDGQVDVQRLGQRQDRAVRDDDHERLHRLLEHLLDRGRQRVG